MEDNDASNKAWDGQQQAIDNSIISKGVTPEEFTVKLPETAIYSEPCTTTSAISLQFAFSSNTNEWFTKGRYINLIKEVFQAGIELDPASCELANTVVQAKRYYTIDDNGLTRPWYASNAYVNPPYKKLKGKSEAGVWLMKLIHEYNAGNVKEAILLVCASTSEQWFQPAFDYPICFTNHRAKFWGPNSTSNAPTKGNAFVYFGKNVDRFARVFESNDIGTVVNRYRQERSHVGEENG